MWCSAVVVSLTLLSAGCGSSGSQKQAKEPITEAEATPVVAEETPEEKFARQQEDTCNKMCQRLIDCSVEDAKAQLSAEEIKELNLEATVPLSIADCTSECSRGSLSPRQVSSIRTCLGEATECSVFNECLGGAQ